MTTTSIFRTSYRFCKQRTNIIHIININKIKHIMTYDVNNKQQEMAYQLIKDTNVSFS